MQALADGYFILPYTISDYLSGDIGMGKISTDTPEFEEAESDVIERINRLISSQGTHSVNHFHKKLGNIMWQYCGINRYEEGLKTAMTEIKALREEFWKEVIVPGTEYEYNEELAKAGRLADFLELAELYARDALYRKESCGAHFREEYITADGEAMRDDKNYGHVAAWEYIGEPGNAILHKEKLEYESIQVKQRSYK
jgi:succinate dehydrogenase / fumarate reductase flavoprotein subunit